MTGSNWPNGWCGATCIFLGDIEKYFSRFGVVDAVNLKYDLETGISRGFAFVSFVDEKSADLALKKIVHVINNRYIEARRAKSRPVFKKLFVGGIDTSLSVEEIRNYFTRFGKVGVNILLSGSVNQ